MRRKLYLAAAAGLVLVVLLLTSLYRHGRPGHIETVAARKPPAPAPVAAPPAPFTETDWFALVPRDWEPGKTFSADMARLSDEWAHAPVDPSLDNTRIRIAGFMIPLDTDNGVVHEFLIVPYFGACIHAPPPPANQVIHAFARHPLHDVRMMDPVYVSGTLRIARDQTPDSAAGLIDVIGYEMQAEAVTPYKVQ
jgi:hypothetical protein